MSSSFRSKEDIEKAYLDGLEQMKKNIHRYSGVPPKMFTFEREKYTPLEFEELYDIPKDKTFYIEYSNSNCPSGYFGNKSRKEVEKAASHLAGYNISGKSISHIAQKMVDWVNSERPMQVSFKWGEVKERLKTINNFGHPKRWFIV